MKFITEKYLRDLFKKEPFTTYELSKEERLTPGAREFLYDKKVNVSDDKKEFTDIDLNKIEDKQDNIKINQNKEKFDNKLKLIQAIFFDAAQDLLYKDILLAQLIIKLVKELIDIKDIPDKYSMDTPSYFTECKGIKASNLKDNLDECFEITDFHIQLENGKQIIILYKLRCYIKELELLFLDLYENDESEFKTVFIDKINETRNILSQRICFMVGGKVCQRKI